MPPHTIRQTPQIGDQNNRGDANTDRSETRGRDEETITPSAKDNGGTITLTKGDLQDIIAEAVIQGI